MDFFGVGIGEILLILAVALLIWGPGRIVEVGRTLGKVVRNLSKMSSSLTAQITKDLEDEGKERPPRREQQNR